jgi:hypothetical protein
VPILPDANDQTDIVAGTEEGEPGELVRCVEMHVDIQFTILYSGPSNRSAIVPISFRTMVTVRSRIASIMLGLHQEMV